MSPSLTDLVDHFCLIAFALLTMSSFFEALTSSIAFRVNLQSNGPTLSILSIAAEINAQVSISVLIGNNASPEVSFSVEVLCTSIRPTLERR